MPPVPSRPHRISPKSSFAKDDYRLNARNGVLRYAAAVDGGGHPKPTL
jgi:hypothetical protein